MHPETEHSAAASDAGAPATTATSSSTSTSVSSTVSGGVTISAQSTTSSTTAEAPDSLGTTSPTDIPNAAGSGATGLTDGGPSASSGATTPVPSTPPTAAAPTPAAALVVEVPPGNAIEQSNDSTPAATQSATTPQKPGQQALSTTSGHLDTFASNIETAGSRSVDTSATARALSTTTPTNAASAVTAPAIAAVPAAPAGPVQFVASVVSAFLSPFLSATSPTAPTAPQPLLWAVLGWVRRNLFNDAPTITQISVNPQQNVTGVITGKVNATDREGDPLSYTVVTQPANGTVTIDANGNYTYTPDTDFGLAGGGVQTFGVQVTDGKFNLLTFLFNPRHADTETIALNVESTAPSVIRNIIDLPDTLTNPRYPDFTSDGKIIFDAKPTIGGKVINPTTGEVRSEIYSINEDGTGLECLTCGLAPNLNTNLAKPFFIEDGSNRILVRVGDQNPQQSVDNYIFEPTATGGQLVKVQSPPPGTAIVIQANREMRVSPDGQHVAFTQVILGQGFVAQIVSVVGDLQRTETGAGPIYQVTNSRVVYTGGELKDFTPDGKGAVIADFTGPYDAGNPDDVRVDLTTGAITRITTNLDYDEDTAYSPNENWLVIGSARGLDYTTAMSQIKRPIFVPAYVVGPVFIKYRGDLNLPFLNTVDGELNGRPAIPLYDPADIAAWAPGDGLYFAEPIANWNDTGDAITFWESDEPLLQTKTSRLVVAHLKNVDGGTQAADRTTPDTASWAPALSTFVPGLPPLEGSRSGKVGGTAVVTSVTDAATRLTTRTVTYTDYADDAGFIINGTEQTVSNSMLTNVHYTGSLTVSGDHSGSLSGDATIVNQQQLTGFITSTLDGKTSTIGTLPAAATF